MNPTFVERWVAGTYLVCGIFPTQVSSLTIDAATKAVATYYAATKSHKRRRWPKGICGYYLIPIYIAETFDATIIEWVHSRHDYRWAIWHEPVLYSTASNHADMRADYGLYGRAFRPFLFQLVSAALHTIASQYHPGVFCAINASHDSTPPA